MKPNKKSPYCVILFTHDPRKCKVIYSNRKQTGLLGGRQAGSVKKEE